MSITDPTEPFFKDGHWTWDGTRWRKQPLMFGFSELAGENLENTSLAAGANNLNGAAVGAGELLIVRHLALMYSGTPPTYMGVYPVGSPGTPYILFEHTVVSTRWYIEPVFAVLEEGDYLTAFVGGATLNDNLYFRYLGYKTTIAE
jgi:hypothetical protein